MPKTPGKSELERLGFEVVLEYPHRPGASGKWYEIVTPLGDYGVMLRQSSRNWHYFPVRGDARHGESPLAALSGTQDDTTKTEQQITGYAKLVWNAPDRLAQLYKSISREMLGAAAYLRV